MDCRLGVDSGQAFLGGSTAISGVGACIFAAQMCNKQSLNSNTYEKAALLLFWGLKLEAICLTHLTPGVSSVTAAPHGLYQVFFDFSGFWTGANT